VTIFRKCVFFFLRKCVFCKNVLKTFLLAFSQKYLEYQHFRDNFAKMFTKTKIFVNNLHFRENVWNTNIFAKVLDFRKIFTKTNIFLKRNFVKLFAFRENPKIHFRYNPSGILHPPPPPSSCRPKTHCY
jgi:hypothetical protein